MFSCSWSIYCDEIAAALDFPIDRDGLPARSRETSAGAQKNLP
jgi:hypothetical protein